MESLYRTHCNIKLLCAAKILLTVWDSLNDYWSENRRLTEFLTKEFTALGAQNGALVERLFCYSAKEKEYLNSKHV